MCLIAGFVLLALLGVAFAASEQDNYGANDANTKFFFDTKKLGGNEEYNYLALRDHKGPSGVPFGGIGVGYFNFAPDGRFTRVALNNTHTGMKDTGKGCFFAMWEKRDGKSTARRLIRDSETSLGMPGYQHTTYTGLFPRAEISYDNGPESSDNVKVSIYAYSGLVAHNIKDSSLPVAWFDVTLSAKEATEVSVALAWEDFIYRVIKDPTSVQGMDGQIFENDRFNLINHENWHPIKRTPTFAKNYKNGVFSGVLQFTQQPMTPKKATFQNYIDHIVIAADPGKNGNVSIAPAYDLSSADSAWAPFVNNGMLNGATGEVPLSNTDGSITASGVAVKTKLAKGEKKTIRFVIAWYMPELKIDRATAEPGSYWDKVDYGRYMHNYFSDIDSLIAYAVKERARIHKQTCEWQEPVLKSTMPDWLKFKLINSAYTMFTNTILNKAGDFTVMEGMMGGLAGTMDQRISAHPFYQKFFTQLDRSEMQLFADCQDPEGYILHFIGQYYMGMATTGGRAPTEKSYMLDNTGGWILQLAKDYAQTGDIEYLKHNADHVRRALAHLKTKMPEGVNIPVGSTTYDDYHNPPVYSYMAGLYLAILKAGAYIGEEIGDTAMVNDCNQQFVKSHADMMKMLWNGKFFAHGCEIDGSNKRDDILFTGQLAGQFMSRYCGWGDVLSLDVTRSSLEMQFTNSLQKTPNYYANKVWDLTKNEGIDQPGSQCWPFYLESYTAMTGIQAGYLEDGLNIMKHIQLVHLGGGWTWSQNLWNPGQVTYMTAPVTWFITDVLAGSGLDVPSGTLHIAPVGPISGEVQETPVFFPHFWAMVKYEPAKQKASFRVIKTFGNKPIKIRQLVCEPIGLPTSERRTVKIPEFTAKEGAVLDLSPYWDKISGAVRMKAVLK